jgi:N-acetylglucosaminyldiphosphoundecaprenol N-acetyl-beta-D-mannosaminyltransferase
MTRAQTVDAATALVEAGRPSFFITANTHYAMLAREDPRLREVSTRAAFVVADGAPLVWAARWQGTPLPERVAGSDLIYDLSARAARRGFRLFLLGGAPGVADVAAHRLSLLFPGLRVVGTESPPFRDLTEDEDQGLRDRICSAAPDILILASQMPRGEHWLSAHHADLGVPLCVNLGAALDFAAGRVRRAPRRLQQLGLEWAYRMYREPARLAPRYARNARFVLHTMAHDAVRGPVRRRRGPTVPSGRAFRYQVESSES